jgi:hypothetical protein
LLTLRIYDDLEFVSCSANEKEHKSSVQMLALFPHLV